MNQLANKYGVNLLFDPEQVENKSVQPNDLKGAALEIILKKILTPLQLRFEKLTGNNYVIKSIDIAQPQKGATKKRNNSSTSFIQENIKVAERIIVSGVITDASTGEKLFGVNVIDKKSNTGTSTNLEGAYTLEVDKNMTLEISYIGYITQVIPVESRRMINISLEENATQLNEHHRLYLFWRRARF